MALLSTLKSDEAFQCWAEKREVIAPRKRDWKLKYDTGFKQEQRLRSKEEQTNKTPHVVRSSFFFVFSERERERERESEIAAMQRPWWGAKR